MQKSMVKKFYADEEFKKYGKFAKDWSPCYVFDTVEVINRIGNDVELFSPQWQKNVKKIVTEEVVRQLSSMDEIFKSFKEFLEMQNKR